MSDTTGGFYLEPATNDENQRATTSCGAALRAECLTEGKYFARKDVIILEDARSDVAGGLLSQKRSSLFSSVAHPVGGLFLFRASRRVDASPRIIRHRALKN